MSMQKLLIIGGPAGTGKSTVAEFINESLEPVIYLEGDNLHPDENRIKMSRGQPLTDIDRIGWFLAIDSALSGVSASGSRILLTCSGLKRAHRTVLRKIAQANDMESNFLFMTASQEELERRVGGRKNHFMKAQMVASQLQTMELPGKDEADVLVVDVEGLSTEVVFDKALSLLA